MLIEYYPSFLRIALAVGLCNPTLTFAGGSYDRVQVHYSGTAPGILIGCSRVTRNLVCSDIYHDELDAKPLRFRVIHLQKQQRSGRGEERQDDASDVGIRVIRRVHV